MPDCHSTSCAMATNCQRTAFRYFGLDRLRGLAVVLMVADHALVAASSSLAGPGSTLLRLTLTRASLPLFCIVAGSLVGSVARWRRLATIGAAGVVAALVGAPVGIGQPDVLLLLVAALALVPYLRSRAATGAVLVAALLQPTTWPVEQTAALLGLHVPWTGYQPGLIVALVLVGRWLGAARLNPWPERHLPQLLAVAGRRPVVAYLGHLVILGGITWAF